MTAPPLFEIDADLYVPSDYTRGLWDPRAQHGGPPSALLARAIERFEDGERMFTTRVTVELLRPVPLAPLALTVGFERPGKRVQLVRASLRADGVDGPEVARATGLRIRRGEVQLPEPRQPALAAPPHFSLGRDRSDREPSSVHAVVFHRVAVEHRVVAGGYELPGPAIDWIRVRHPLVAGEPTSALCRTMMAADFGSGLSIGLDRNQGYTFINADLTVYLHREAEGEWICVDARSEVSPLAIGVTESRLWDEQGPIGRAQQSLLIERRTS